MATHRVDSTERAAKKLARLLILLKRLGVFDDDLHIVTGDIRRCVENWKRGVFESKTIPGNATSIKKAEGVREKTSRSNNDNSVGEILWTW
jgi:hypothetical protein